MQQSLEKAFGVHYAMGGVQAIAQAMAGVVASQGSQVVHGDLVMEESSVLDGSAKVHGQVRMARGCLVTGTVFGMDRMAVGPGGRLRGTVSVQESLHIAAHCALGWADQPVSVSARRIVVGEGTTVHGVIWALIQGRVEAEAA